MNHPLNYPCACAFAKIVNDKNPFHFPRVGLSTDVLYRCSPIIKHRLTGEIANIFRSKEADDCCFAWFDQSLTGPDMEDTP